MIVQAFLRWIETAKASDRARAANALGRAFLYSPMAPDERRTAQLAMTYLLDDPAPQVRLALAEALADSSEAPRSLMVSLAEDQLEIACTVVLRSPVLTDADLVDLVGRGSDMLRAVIAARPELGVGVAAAVAEIGDEDDAQILLENRSARLSRLSLRRLAERHGGSPAIRGLLLERCDLPADVRHLLLRHVTDALSGSPLVRAAMAPRRVDSVTREARAAATMAIAASVAAEDQAALVEHLRESGTLTPSFLMQTLCAGRTDFFSLSIASLSGLEERRVRGILATGRFHAVRALLESAGLGRHVSPVFVEAILVWREPVQSSTGLAEIARRLTEKFGPGSDAGEAAGLLLALVEKLAMTEERRSARDFANGLALAAA